MSKKITQLPDATLPLAGTEIFPLVQDGETRQASLDDVSGAVTTEAQNWAEYTGGDVPGNPGHRSSKSWAQEDLAGVTYQGSAKDWAQSASLPDGTSKSAKSYAADAETSATNAASAEATAQLLIASLRFDTKANMDADLAHAAGTFAVVYADPTATNNQIYYKIGASGVGSWAPYQGDRITIIENETVNYRAAGDPIGTLISVTDTDWALQFIDDDDKVVAGFRTSDLWETINSKVDETLEVGTSMTLNGFIESAPSLSAGYLWAIEDSAGNTAIGVRPGGLVDVNLSLASLPVHYDSQGGVRFHAMVCFVINAGQSLSVGALGAIITSRPYDNSKLSSPTSTEFLDGYEATLANPAAGTLAFTKQLLAERNGINYTDQVYRLVYQTTGVSAKTIAELSPGGGSGAFENGTTGMASAKAIADAVGFTFGVTMVTWTQGEADGATSEATYKQAEMDLADAYNDAAIALGQTYDIIFCSYQCCSVGSATNKDVPVAQWKAGNEHPLIRVACPIYFMDYGDFQHLTAASEDWLGGYYGLVHWTEVNCGKKWEPLQPIDVRIVGNNLDVYFNKKDLVLDTTLMPAQTASGFKVENSGGVSQAISSVTLLNDGRVRLALSTTPAVDWHVKYGFNSVTGKSPFVGGGGNLRDKQGDYFVYRTNPMHNWCVIFDWKV